MARSEQRNPAIATAILIVGAIAHALLCGPAIGCRGFPPIDPIWYGVTYVWPIPILISAYFDSVRFGTRKALLIIYSLVTAFFSAGTMITIVPRQMEVSEMLLGSVFYGPLHLLITFSLEYVAQSLYAKRRRLVEPDGKILKLGFTVSSLFLFVAWISLILGIPLGYKSIVLWSANSAAIQRANNDWQTNALVYDDDQIVELGGYTVQYEFDPETGLQLERRRSNLGFRNQYNARISELIKLHGIPAYSIKSIMPKPDDLIQLLGSADMNLVKSFPYDLTENIYLMRRGSVTRWGATSGSGSDSLSIVTPHSMMGLGDGILPVHTKITNDVIYIRNGAKWIGAFLPDGRMIMSVSQ